MKSYSLFATVPKGIETLLLKELKQLGAEKIRKVRAGISFTGDLETAYRCCLWSRLASRLLLQLDTFTVNSEDDLYDACNAFPWEEHFTVNETFAIDVSLVASPLNHSHYAALKIKDAIVDRFRDRTGERPSVDTRQPGIRINVHLRKREGSLALDLSGDSLHRRGYRQQTGAAPLKENLAAALLLYSGWSEIAAAGGAFCDPMCGSGTLPIEAALMAGDIAPGLLRERFGFNQWLQHDRKCWQRLLDEAHDRRSAGLENIPRITGYDADSAAVRYAHANVAACNLEKQVHIEKRALDSTERLVPTGERPGLVLVNPPYGERLGERKRLRPLYSQLGSVMERDCAGWRGAVLTSDKQLAFTLGLRPEASQTVYNGTLECELLQFALAGGGHLKPSPGPQETVASTPGAEMFANRLRKNRKRLGKWARKNGIECYRIYDADMPEYAVAIDLYGDRVHLQEYAPPASVDEQAAQARMQDIVEVLPGVLQVPREHVHVKVRERQRGTAQYRRKSGDGEFFPVREGDAKLLVNLSDYLDTGLFLDHRPVRAMIGELSAGKRFLNLFAYTGTASVHAALGGATGTTSVDMSKTYLDWARRNLELNECAEEQHRLVQADCLEWVRQEQGEYDLVFLDPPSFSNSKRMETTFDVQRDHVALLRSVTRLLAPDGQLIFSTNLRRFRIDRDALSDLDIEDISAATIPEDFRRNARIHHCFRIRSRG